MKKLKSERQRLGWTIVTVVIAILTCSYFICLRSASANNQKKRKLIIQVERFKDFPIIKPEMLPEDEGENINGLSLIRVPDWVAESLERYYLYFFRRIIFINRV